MGRAWLLPQRTALSTINAVCTQLKAPLPLLSMCAAPTFAVDKGSWHAEITALNGGSMVLMSAARDAQVAMEASNSCALVLL